MARVVKTLLVMICLAAPLMAVPVAHGQFGGAAVGFRNELKTPVIVQGTSIVNGMPKRGQAIAILPGQAVVDINVPAGLRYYTIVDANQPRLILIRNLPVPVNGQDLSFALRGVAPKVVLEPLP